MAAIVFYIFFNGPFLHLAGWIENGCPKIACFAETVSVLPVVG